MRGRDAAPLAALVLALSLMALTGCGGGQAEQPGTAPPVEQSAQATELPPVAELPDRSRPESAVVFEPFPTEGAVPEALAAKIEAGQPTLILFVDGAQKVSDEVRAAADRALKEYTGAVDLVLFDLGKYVSVDASGLAVAKENELKKDENASRAVTLARTLGVNGLPYIVMTDDQGYIVFRHRGLVDAPYLLMHMERLTD